jgi:phage anti-repressor protein
LLRETVVNPSILQLRVVCLAPGVKGFIILVMPNTQHELIPISQMGTQEQWVDARTLHQFLQVGKDFSTWIKDFIADFGFIEGRDFSPNLGKSSGGRQAIEYSITLDMAKELSMLQRSEKGKQARQYFIACEKKLRSVQSHLLSGYYEVEQLLQQCDTQHYNNALWYAAGQLRRLAGKGNGGGYQYKIKLLQPEDKIVKLPHRGQLSWFVRADAVQEILCVKNNQLVAAAMVKLLNKGGTHA